MKQTQPRRYWEDARAKVDEEGRCRLWRSGECHGALAASHVIGREHDPHMANVPGIRYDLYVRPVSVVPLCRHHHDRYDPHTRGTREPVDLFGYLTLEEELAAVADAGGIGLALRRLCPSEYRKHN